MTQGLAVGQLALRFGANDMGSVMIEENVVAAAGTSFRATEDEIRRAIQAAGYSPRKRNVFYELVDIAGLLGVFLVNRRNRLGTMKGDLRIAMQCRLAAAGTAACWKTRADVPSAAKPRAVSSATHLRRSS